LPLIYFNQHPTYIEVQKKQYLC